jgi:hypothetical protein
VIALRQQLGRNPFTPLGWLALQGREQRLRVAVRHRATRSDAGRTSVFSDLVKRDLEAGIGFMEHHRPGRRRYRAQLARTTAYN